MGFSRQEFWIGLPCPPPGDLPNPGIEPACLMFPALAGGFFTTSEVKSLNCVQLFGTLWTVAHQAPPSMGFSRQEYWSGLPILLQGIFPTQESNPCLPHRRQTLYSLSPREALPLAPPRRRKPTGQPPGICSHKVGSFGLLYYKARGFSESSIMTELIWEIPRLGFLPCI